MKFEFHENTFLHHLTGLLRIRSVNGDCGPISNTAPLGQGVYDALEYMLALGREFGFRTKNVDGYCGWIEMGEGNEMGAVLAHVDTVAVDDGWTYPPFDATIAGGRVYGRGSIDDKGPALVALYAMKALIDSGVNTKKRIRLILGGDEEHSGRCLDRYRETEEIPVCAFTPDADYPVTYAEKGILNIRLSTVLDGHIVPMELTCGHTISIVPAFAEATIEERHYTAEGKASHAMCPQHGENALLKLCGQLCKEGVDHPVVQLASILTREGLHIDFSDEPSGELTLNPAIARVNGEIAYVDCDIRVPVTVEKQEVLKAIAQSVQPLGFAVEELVWSPPLYVTKDSSLVVTLQSVYRECTGDNREPVSTGGGTYARAFKNAVAFGALLPGDEHTYHKNDEYWSLASIRTNFQIMANAMAQI